MTKWVKEYGDTLVYATQADFPGVVNWSAHDALCRSRGWLPLRGEPEPREGFSASPKAWHVHTVGSVRVEPRQVRVDDWEEDPETHERRVVGWHYEMRDTEVTLDKSAIVVDEWAYTPIPVPPPAPERYSILRIYDALRAAGIWEDVRAAIEESGQMERLTFANELATDYPPFAAFLAQMRTAYGDQTVDEILAYAKI